MKPQNENFGERCIYINIDFFIETNKYLLYEYRHHGLSCPSNMSLSKKSKETIKYLPFCRKINWNRNMHYYILAYEKYIIFIYV